MSKLPFLKDEDLYREVKAVLDAAIAAVDSAEAKLHSNVVDPFSAVMDATRQEITIKKWLEQEKARQIQKSMQNAVGTFHQRILGCVAGWQNLESGNVLDLENTQKQIIAEIKNKHNTTKGNHKKEIYNDILSLLSSSHKGYTGYYVEVIPKSSVPYNKPFTPSDNVTGAAKPKNDSIRVIDGRTFYFIATGYEDALDQLYEVLPLVAAEILGRDHTSIVNDPEFKGLFKKAYPYI